MKLGSTGLDDALNGLAYELERLGWRRTRRAVMALYGGAIRLTVMATRIVGRREPRG